MRAFLLAAAILPPLPTLAQPARPAVTIDSGTLAGIVDDADIRTCKGIPYAASPVADLRWKEPQPVAA